jgi:hypothetical protein
VTVVDSLEKYYAEVTVVTKNEKVMKFYRCNDSHLKTGVEPTPETSFMSSIPQAMDSVQHSIPVTHFETTALEIFLYLPQLLQSCA